MTVPREYLQATRDFERYLADLKLISMLATHNQCYAMTRAVLRAFRNHLTVGEVAEFANALPAVLRAIFVEDWNPNAPVTAFPDRAALQKEVLSDRADHNTSTETAIADVAAALRRNVDAAAFAVVLARLSPAARAFWQV